MNCDDDAMARSFLIHDDEQDAVSTVEEIWQVLEDSNKLCDPGHLRRCPIYNAVPTCAQEAPDMPQYEPLYDEPPTGTPCYCVISPQHERSTKVDNAMSYWSWSPNTMCCAT